MMGLRCFLALPVLLFAAWTHAGEPVPPARYPEFEGRKTQDLVVVGTMSEGGSLPAFEECASGELICMDPPPFWMRVKVRDVLAGTLDADSVAVASTSHYGAPDTDPEAHYLMFLVSDGQHYVWKRYARARLYSLDDTDYLPGYGESIHWLPCGIQSMAIEVPELTRKGVAALPATDPRKKERALFKIERKQAVPRLWIPMPALKRYLTELPVGEARTCDTAG